MHDISCSNMTCIYLTCLFDFNNYHATDACIYQWELWDMTAPPKVMQHRAVASTFVYYYVFCMNNKLFNLV